ncbi:malto-oligosyltrehalose synthase [Rhodococcus sp. IEGM 1379]|uniref:malto-oligosyltrehalose synthase n=1 Tax=Rhodococcus sp. IEGM 1379 TaxID=3047086 RepID=UPI0024B745A7|nr:malto-oligosyltrehalose synthase [Rhodococcus sp. IEGM 1379]MDI9914170.1 malto-oligosyltrehalose synthase [Rhodococcus sp. IEGM 1379]
MAPITSTYRLQLRPDAFTLRDAAKLVDYLDELGVSHLYLSPILTATSGSTHGYDVTDPTTVSEGLGGRDALVELARRIHERGMGLIVDLVPNHVGVAKPQENAWWWDVLTHGRSSEYADFFDIDWDRGNGADGKLALPMLGKPSDLEALQIDHSNGAPLLAFYEHRFPIAPGTESVSPSEVHERQSYRLVPWNTGISTYRRFFTVNELAALRQEDPRVFELCHRELKSWVDEGLIDGVRIDHPDGLTDPASYLVQLRELIGPDQWIVIEKILGHTEPLDPLLPVDGTTGYDALNQLGGVFVNPGAEHEFSELSAALTGNDGDRAWLHHTERQLKRETARGELAPEIRRLVRAIQLETGGLCSDKELNDAVVVAVARMPVYRSDYSPLAGLAAHIFGEIHELAPGYEVPFNALTQALSSGGEATIRFQQVCGAVMAKSVEDRLFYRTARLISRQEVGGNPAAFAVSVAEFHLANADRARLWPKTMTTLSTHDTKRGEDVRARISVLSQMPTLWSRLLRDWEEAAPSPDALTGLFLWQNLVGVWPVGAPTPDFRSRVHAYAQKAIREAALRTSWNSPDSTFETAVHRWIDDAIDGSVGKSISELVLRIARHAWSDSLGQKLLQICGPGIPDIYQGTELWEDSLVDPDNRRLVDFDIRKSLLDSPATPVDATGAAKLRLVRTALQLRRENPDWFIGGTYRPILASGAGSGHVIGFSRGPAGADPTVIAVATRHSMVLADHGWGDTTLNLPDGDWTDILTGRPVTSNRMLTILAGGPTALLVRTDS